jgi:hypothetical protein
MRHWSPLQHRRMATGSRGARQPEPPPMRLNHFCLTHGNVQPSPSSSLAAALSLRGPAAVFLLSRATPAPHTPLQPSATSISIRTCMCVPTESLCWALPMMTLPRSNQSSVRPVMDDGATRKTPAGGVKEGCGRAMGHWSHANAPLRVAWQEGYVARKVTRRVAGGGTTGAPTAWQAAATAASRVSTRPLLGSKPGSGTGTGAGGNRGGIAAAQQRPGLQFTVQGATHAWQHGRRARRPNQGARRRRQRPRAETQQTKGWHAFPGAIKRFPSAATGWKGANTSTEAVLGAWVVEPNP